MKKINNSRRQFIKTTAVATAGATLGGLSLSAGSYRRVSGATDRINIAIVGLGRRWNAYIDPIIAKKHNVHLLYLCDVMESQMTKAAKHFSEVGGYTPKTEGDFFKVIADKEVDVIFNATPDHWHAPGTWLANEAGKHVYLEKPCTHNPYEGELLVRASKKYGKVVQIGNQQRSASETIEIINDIHNGVLGEAYLAQTFYINQRGRVVNPEVAPVPEGLNWDLWQGPAPRQPYRHNTWDYEWHWYDWDYGTAETGNNALHEFDIARWALKVKHPETVSVDADKYHWKDDGWSMYDTMDATLKYPGGKTIKWDGKSRNSYNTYGAGRGTIIYGTEGSAYIDRNGYKLYNRGGNLIRERQVSAPVDGTQLGGGGDSTYEHVVNFFEAVRGKAKLKSPIDEGIISTLMCHLSNIAYRTGEVLQCDPDTGKIKNSKKAMALWQREYEKGWGPNF